MRKLVSIFIFLTALFVGIFIFPTNTPTLYEKIYPSLSPAEKNLLIGKKVVNNSDNKSFIGLKYPLGMKYTLDDTKGDIVAEVGENGETGTVVDLREFMKVENPEWRKLLKDCNLLVKWDKKNEDGSDMFSCHGRFSSRKFLEFE